MRGVCNNCTLCVVFRQQGDVQLASECKEGKSESRGVIRECEVVTIRVERMVREVKVVQIVPRFRFLCVNNREKL